MPPFPENKGYEDIRILILEDNPFDAELIEYKLRQSGLVFTSLRVEDEVSFLAALNDYCPDLILSDYDLPTFDGARALRTARECCPDVPFILVTGALSEERVIDILTSGATDYVLKNRLSRLVPAVTRALHELYELRRRKQAEAERDNLLKDLEHRIQGATEDLNRAQAVAKTGSWKLDTRRDELLWSDETYRIFGVPKGKHLAYEDFLAMVHPDDREHVDRKWTEALAGGKYDIEHRIIVKGKVKWVRERAELDFDENGLLLGGFGTVQDITGRKRAEDALKESEYMLKTALEGSNTGIWVLSPQSGDLKGSPQLNILFGRSPGSPAMSKDDFYSQIHPDDISRIEKAWKKAIEKRTLYDQDYRVVWPDGSVHWLTSKGKIKAEPGEQTQFVGVTYDITNRKRSEEDRKRQSEFENIILRILSRFAVCTATEIDDEIKSSLEEIGTFLGLDNAYIVLVSRESRTWSSVYSWSAPGVPSFSHKYQNVPIGTDPWSEKALLRMEVIQINSLEDLPPEAKAEKEEWESEGLKSHMLVPLRGRGGLVTGSVGLRSYSRQIKWTQDDVRTLRLFSNSIANVLERKRTEEVLAENEEKYRLIFESSLSGIMITKPDGTVMSANPAAQQILGMTEEEIILAGRSGISDLSDPRLGPALEKRARSGRFFGELNFRKKDGTIFPVEVSSVRMRSQKGRTFTSIIFRDITWRKNAEKVLMESSHHFRELADSMPQLVWTGTPDGRIDYFNVRYAEFSGLERDSSGFWQWKSAVHPEDLPKTLDVCKRAAEEQSENHVEHRLKGKDGTYQWYLSRGVPIRDKDGTLIKWIGTTTDIDDLKEAEAVLTERTEEIEQTNKELESFSYSVSHDLRAPLRAIDGFSRMLLGKEQTLDQDANRKLQIIRENAVKMDRLINDLLYFSRSGREPMSSGKIDMDRLIKEIWDEQLSANPDRKIELKKEKIPKAVGDEALIRQVLSNLLSNAVKFSKKKQTAKIEIAGESNQKENVYFVKDNGAGFDMKYYDKMFGVFQRLHSESEYEGTGVGLAIVQRIIHRHGGRVWAEGKIGKGATFYFSLPKHRVTRAGILPESK